MVEEESESRFSGNNKIIFNDAKNAFLKYHFLERYTQIHEKRGQK